MKRFVRLLPLVAIAFGVVLVLVASAFKKAPNTNTVHGKYTLYTFQYSGPDYSVAHVEDPANWTYVSLSPGCSGNQKACSIEASDTYVDASGSAPVLKSSINIQAVLTPATSTARVTSIADPNGGFANQTN